MAFDPTNPADVTAARAYFDAIEADELAWAQASVERFRSGVDGPGMPIEEFMALHGLPIPEGF